MNFTRVLCKTLGKRFGVSKQLELIFGFKFLIKTIVKRVNRSASLAALMRFATTPLFAQVVPESTSVKGTDGEAPHNDVSETNLWKSGKN